MTQSSHISEEVPLPLIEGSFSKALFPTREYSQMLEKNSLPLTESSFNRIKITDSKYNYLGRRGC
jgi:hypothetical protein